MARHADWAPHPPMMRARVMKMVSMRPAAMSWKMGSPHLDKDGLASIASS